MTTYKTTWTTENENPVLFEEDFRIEVEIEGDEVKVVDLKPENPAIVLTDADRATLIQEFEADELLFERACEYFEKYYEEVRAEEAYEAR